MSRFAFRTLPSRFSVLAATALVGFAACGGGADADPDTDGPSDDFSTDDFNVDLDEGGGGADSGQGGGGAVVIQDALPGGFTANTAVDGGTPRGGWDYVGPVENVDNTDSSACGNVLRVIARDFDVLANHPDFGDDVSESTTEIVTGDLGEDRKPIFKQATVSVESKATFDQWYRNIDSVNVPHVLDLWLEPVGETFVFDSGSFFPLDELGSSPKTPPKIDNASSDGALHRFLFTTELHTKFEYQGGETFTFRGDDDVFVYIDGKLAVNLGGIHGPEVGTVDIDDFAEANGMQVGDVYTFDLFQAERKPSGSNFRIETTLDFSGCSEILPSDVK